MHKLTIELSPRDYERVNAFRKAMDTFRESQPYADDRFWTNEEAAAALVALGALHWFEPSQAAAVRQVADERENGANQ